MPIGTLAKSLTIGGESLQDTVGREFDHADPVGFTVPAAKTCTDWVKTDANTAACNLPDGHGYTNGNFAVYWTGGKRIHVPGTISTNALSLDGGSGTDFPASGTSVIVCREVTGVAPIDGDALSLLGLNLEYTDRLKGQIGHADFQDVSSATIEALDLASHVIQDWDIAGGATNVFTGNPITKVVVSHNRTSADARFRVLHGADSTP